MKRPPTTIGRTAVMEIIGEPGLVVPVKIDTGADRSSIWASDFHISHDGELSYVFFDKDYPLYTGIRHRTHSFGVSRVRSSTGHEQIRYRVKLVVEVAGRRVRGTFTLADRSKNTYPVLIGCTLLNKKFIVDVSKGIRKRPAIARANVKPLNRELKEDPRAFFEKYHQDNEEKEDA